MSRSVTDQQLLNSPPTQLRSNVSNKLNYLNNMFDRTLKMVHKLNDENRQLKVLVSILLHFKHMFLYVKKSKFLQEEELYDNLGVDSLLFETDLNQCLSQFNGMVESCRAVKFVRKKELYYDANEKYCAFLEDDLFMWKENEEKLQENATVQRHNLRRSARVKQSLQRVNNEQQLNGDDECDPIDLKPEVDFVTLSDNDDEWDLNDGGDNSDDEDFSPAGDFSKQPSAIPTTAIQKTVNLPTNRTLKCANAQRTFNAKRSVGELNDSGYQLADWESSEFSKKQKRQAPQVLDESSGDCANDCDEEVFYFEEDDEAYRQSGFKCPVEGCIWEPFDRKKDLNIHLLDGHGMAPYACLVETCNAGFESRTHMLSHLKVHQDASITCDLCMKLFPASHFYQHFYKEHRQECKQAKTAPQEDCIYSNEDCQYAEQVATAERHDCCWVGCDRAFSSAKDLKEHMQYHATNTLGGQSKQFRCTWEGCELNYITEHRSHLIRHIRSRHFGLPRTVKEQMQKNIVDQRDPNEFIELVDPTGALTANSTGSGAKKHFCRWLGCDRLYNTRYELKEHLHFHVTRFVRRNRCLSCGYESANRNHVLRHIRSRHFGLPRSIKEQMEKNIVDDRNPRDWMETVEVAKPPIESVQQQPELELLEQQQSSGLGPEIQVMEAVDQQVQIVQDGSI